MAEVLGHVARMAINMGTTASPVWKQFQNEVETNIDISADKEEVSSKDTGVHKKYLKTLLDSTASVKAYDDLTPATNFLSYKDILTIMQKTAGSTGGTVNNGKGNGVYEMRLNSVTTGDVMIAFDGFIDSLSQPHVNMAKREYTFGIQAISNPVPTTVV